MKQLGIHVPYMHYHFESESFLYDTSCFLPVGSSPWRRKILWITHHFKWPLGTLARVMGYLELGGGRGKIMISHTHYAWPAGRSCHGHVVITYSYHVMWSISARARVLWREIFLTSPYTFGQSVIAPHSKRRDWQSLLNSCVWSAWSLTVADNESYFATFNQWSVKHHRNTAMTTERTWWNSIKGDLLTRVTQLLISTF